MTRKTGSSGQKTLAALHDAGLKRLYKQGFAGMTLRELASDVGVQAGSLYNHFSNKQEFLCSVLEKVMTDLIEELTNKLEGAENPREALLAYIECHVIFHSYRRKEILISTTELRSLTPENYKKIVAMRDEYERYLREILEWGHRENFWGVTDFKIVTKLILGMMTSVGIWYRADGPVDVEGIVEIYQSMIEGLLDKEIRTLEVN